MSPKTVMLDETVYERIRSKQRDDETISEAIDRLTAEYSLRDFAGGYTDEEADRHRTLLERSKRIAVEDHQELLGQMDTDGD